jgi:hypothetical protein
VTPRHCSILRPRVLNSPTKFQIHAILGAWKYYWSRFRSTMRGCEIQNAALAFCSCLGESNNIQRYIPNLPLHTHNLFIVVPTCALLTLFSSFFVPQSKATLSSKGCKRQKLHQNFLRMKDISYTYVDTRPEISKLLRSNFSFFTVFSLI